MTKTVWARIGVILSHVGLLGVLAVATVVADASEDLFWPMWGVERLVTLGFFLATLGALLGIMPLRSRIREIHLALACALIVGLIAHAFIGTATSALLPSAIILGLALIHVGFTPRVAMST